LEKKKMLPALIREKAPSQKRTRGENTQRKRRALLHSANRERTSLFIWEIEVQEGRVFPPVGKGKGAHLRNEKRKNSNRCARRRTKKEKGKTKEDEDRSE